MTKQINTAEEARAIIRRSMMDSGRDLVIPAIMEWANCREADVDDDGRIWIANPQRGHWLSDDDLIKYVNWDLAR